MPPSTAVKSASHPDGAPGSPRIRPTEIYGWRRFADSGRWGYDLSFDVAQLSAELAALRAHPHARKVAIVVPVDADRADMTRAAVAEGPPFDPVTVGLNAHEVILSPDEAVFVFDLGDGAERLETILASSEFWDVVGWCEHIAVGQPRLGVVAYSWQRGAGEAPS